MVRLFVPEGEGQHVLVRRQTDPLAADHRTVTVPWKSTVYAAGTTAFLALVGVSRPGIFLKTTAYFSAANITFAVCDTYARRDINRAVFKLDNIEPRPGQLYQRTQNWTVDDVVVGGGILGAFLSLNPRALHGVTGWKRFLGAATVGAALGGYVGERRLTRFHPQLMERLHKSDAMNRMAEYERLQQDTKAKESLSMLGRFALSIYTWPIIRLPTNILGFGSPAGMGNTPGGAQVQNPHAHISQQEMDQHTLIQIEFNKGELNGPDIERGYRGYKDSLAGRDELSIRDWLERLEEVRKRTAKEAQYLWQHLASKEEEFYTLQTDAREKDVRRREVQLLNNMASDFATRDAILAYHIADAEKRLQQMTQKEPGSPNLMLPQTQTDLPADWRDHHSPHLIAEQIRINWTRQKELLHFIEHSVSMHAHVQAEAGSPAHEHIKQAKQNAEDMKKNVEATERLLKEFEELVHKADDVKKDNT